MRTVRYSFLLMKNNKFFSLLLTLQLAAVLTAVIFMTSVMSYRRNMFRAVEPWFEGGTEIVMIDDRPASEILQRYMGSIDRIYAVPRALLLSEDGSSGIDLNIYDRELFERTPLIYSSGDGSRIFDTDINYCIAAGKGCRVGDRIACTYDGSITAEFTVAAVLEDRQLLPANIDFDMKFYRDYRDFFKLYDSSVAERPLLIISDDCARRQKLATAFSVKMSSVKINEKASAEEIVAQLSSIGCLSFASGEEFADNSREYISSQMYIILPITVCVFVLCLFSAVSGAALTAKKNLRSFAVLFLGGATRKKCVLISVMQNVIISAAGAFLAAAALFIGRRTFIRDTVIILDGTALSICAGVIAVFIICSMIMPLLIIGRTEPREILKEE